MATVKNLEAIGRAKTIGELDPPPSDFGDKVRSLLVPTESLPEGQGKGKNYKLSISDILELLTGADIGLDRVDNTSDLEKPISLATEQELNKKFDKEVDTAADIQGLQSLLDKYRKLSVLVPMGDVDGLVEALEGCAKRVHSHSRNEAWLANIIEDFAPVDHNHRLNNLIGWSTFIEDLQVSLADRPTSSEVDAMLDNKITSRNLLEVKEFEWDI